MVDLLIPFTLQILQHILQILQQVLLRPVQLLGALEKGNEMVKMFMKERFIKVERQEKPQKSFYDPLPKANVKTMADRQKDSNCKDQKCSHEWGVMCLCLFAVNSLMSSEKAPAPLFKHF